MKYLTPLRIACALLFAVAILWVVEHTMGGLSCSIVYKTQTVQGASLTGFIDPGTEVRTAFGYYACNSVERGDVVLYRDSGVANPLIKIVKAIGGDRFMLAYAENGMKILINGEVLKTTTGAAYLLSAESSALLSLYEQDYKGVVPRSALLLFGNIASGSRDSTQFGLVSVDNLLGKVVNIVR